MNNSKKLIAASLALAMSMSAMPINAFASGAENSVNNRTNVSYVNNLDENLLSGRSIEDLEAFQSNLEKEMAKIQEIVKLIKSGVDAQKAYLHSELEKNKSQIDAVIDGLIFSESEVENLNKTAKEAKKAIDDLIGSQSQIKKNKLKKAIEMAVSQGAITLEEAARFSQVSEQVTNEFIDDLYNEIDRKIEIQKDRIENHSSKFDLTKDEERERDRIIDKIKDADSLDDIDDIYIPDYLKYNLDIIKAKSDRRKDLNDDNKTHSSDYRDEEKLDVRRIRINQDEDNRGKWIVEGYADNHIREYVSIYYEGRFVGGGTTDGEGYFEITVSEKVYDNSSLKFYAGKNKYFENDNIKIEPWDLKVSTYYIEGKYNKDTLVKAYYKGRYVGESRTNSDGKFKIKANEQIFNKDDLTFYTNNNTNNDSKNINIISANVGDTKIVGTSTPYAEILVRDDDKVRLGNTKADINGNFTILLNRGLKANETIKFTITDKDRNEINVDYTVSDISKGNLSRISYAKGYPDGNFKAGANISRAESVMMISRLINGSDNFNTPNTTKFEDAEDGWYAQAINFVVDKGIMKGYPNGDFEPNSYITRAEFAEMVSRYLNLENKGNTGLVDIKDHWAKNAIETLYGNKIIKGYPDGTFKPNENITRAEAVTVLNAAFNRKSDLNSMENIKNKEMLITFNDVRKSDWYYAEVLDAANAHESYLSGDTEIWTVVK